jgi:hypothetical protein
MITKNTKINIQGCGWAQSHFKVTASEVMDAGDIVYKSSATEGAKAAPAQVNVESLFLLEEKDFGIRELTEYSQADELAGYAVGDTLEMYRPMHGYMWGVNLHNSTGGDLDLTMGQKLVMSPTIAGKLEISPAIDGATVVGTILFELAVDVTVPAGTHVLATCWYIGQ